MLGDKKRAAGTKLSITMSHLKSHLKDYTDLEGLPLLVALKDAQNFFAPKNGSDIWNNKRRGELVEMTEISHPLC